MPTAILPASQVPELSVDLLGGEHFTLSQQKPQAFTMLVFYRGYHCPKCLDQLEDLQGKLGSFKDIGVQPLALSMDDKERAEKSRSEWAIKDVPLGYGLSEASAREWGLYMSQKMERPGAQTQEPHIFNEPGLFLVRPDGTLYSASVQSMPFARPYFSDLINAVKFVTEKQYPPRGDLA